MKITKSMIASAYKFSSMVYKNNISRNAAKDMIHKESGMCLGSASDYISIFLYLMKGNVFKRAMSLDSHRYFLDNIRKDYGEVAFQKALSATYEHTRYYASLGRGHLVGIESLVKEYKIEND